HAEVGADEEGQPDADDGGHAGLRAARERAVHRRVNRQQGGPRGEEGDRRLEHFDREPPRGGGRDDTLEDLEEIADELGSSRQLAQSQHAPSSLEHGPRAEPGKGYPGPGRSCEARPVQPSPGQDLAYGGRHDHSQASREATARCRESVTGRPHRRLLAALVCAAVATFAQLYSPQGVLPQIADDLGTTADQAALTVSATTLDL